MLDPSGRVNLVGGFASWKALAALFVSTAARAPFARRRFGELHTYCAFVGYPRSSHSLIGALLNAHPDMAISHELNALRYFRTGFRPSQIYQLILRNAEQFTAQGSTWTNYSYAVPRQYQGRYRRLRVIGDKKGGVTNEMLERDPTLLQRFERASGLPMHVIHVVRNPFDNIATAWTRGLRDRPVSDLVPSFARHYETAERARAALSDDRFMTVHSKQLIADPRGELKRLCGFLGVDADSGYLDDCASIVYGSPSVTRNRIKWSDGAIDAVNELIRQYDFLGQYSYESVG